MFERGAVCGRSVPRHLSRATRPWHILASQELIYGVKTGGCTCEIRRSEKQPHEGFDQWANSVTFRANDDLEFKTLTPDCSNAREQQHTSSINAVVNLEQGVVNPRVEISKAKNQTVRQVFAFR